MYHLRLSRKHNEDEDSPNKLYIWVTYVPVTAFKIYRRSMWMRTNCQVKIKLRKSTDHKHARVLLYSLFSFTDLFLHVEDNAILSRHLYLPNILKSCNVSYPHFKNYFSYTRAFFAFPYEF
jgi:hypothetical protein